MKLLVILFTSLFCSVIVLFTMWGILKVRQEKKVDIQTVTQSSTIHNFSLQEHPKTYKGCDLPNFTDNRLIVQACNQNQRGTFCVFLIPSGNEFIEILALIQDCSNGESILVIGSRVRGTKKWITPKTKENNKNDIAL